MLERISLGQFVPASSYLHALDPRSKIITTLLLALAVFNASFPQQLLLLLLIAVILILMSRINFKNYGEVLKPFGPIILITAFLQMILIPGKPLLDLYLLSISQEGLWAAAALGLRLLLLLVMVHIMTVTTTPMSLLNGLESLLRPLNKIKFPTHELTMIMTISLRFIPILVDEAQRIRTAQLSRGINYSQGHILARLKKLTTVIIPLFRLSFKRAQDLAEAMESRCYQGGEGRTHLYELRLTGKDYLYILLLSGASLIILWF